MSDAARDMQLVIVAAAEGTKAGVQINKDLQEEFRLLGAIGGRPVGPPLGLLRVTAKKGHPPGVALRFYNA